tara:strand:+ start:602 stop:814 length:213 start_codon:yes stop_codon:yes gene_type:complete
VSGSKPDVMSFMIDCSIARMSTRPDRYRYRLSRSPCLFSSAVHCRDHRPHAVSTAPVGSSVPSSVFSSVR